MSFVLCFFFFCPQIHPQIFTDTLNKYESFSPVNAYWMPLQLRSEFWVNKFSDLFSQYIKMSKWLSCGNHTYYMPWMLKGIRFYNVHPFSLKQKIVLTKNLQTPAGGIWGESVGRIQWQAFNNFYFLKYIFRTFRNHVILASVMVSWEHWESSN